MKYQNINTGEIRDFNCKINSNVWSPLETKVAEPVEKTEKPVKKKTKKIEG